MEEEEMLKKNRAKQIDSIDINLACVWQKQQLNSLYAG